MPSRGKSYPLVATTVGCRPNLCGPNPIRGRSRTERRARLPLSDFPPTMASFDVESTPNPNSLKFTVRGRSLVQDGIRTFDSADSDADHPLAGLVSIAGVSDVFVTPSFFTVSKENEAEWSSVRPEVEAVLEAYLNDSGS